MINHQILRISCLLGFTGTWEVHVDISLDTNPSLVWYIYCQLCEMTWYIHWPWHSKIFFWLIYDTEHSMTLTSSWWDTNASGPSRAPVWSHSVMRSFGCSSPPGSVEVNPHPTPLVPPKLHPHSFTLCPVPPLLIKSPTKILLTF